MWLWTIYFWKKTKNMKTQIQNFKLTIVMMGMLLLPISCHKDDLRKPENLTSTKSEIFGYINSDPFIKDFLYNKKNWNGIELLESRSDEDILDAIKLELATQDKKNKFLKDLNKNYGDIYWLNYKKYDANNKSDFVIFLPMKDSKQEFMTGVILASVEGGKITFEFVTRNQVKKLLSNSKGKEN